YRGQQLSFRECSPASKAMSASIPEPYALSLVPTTTRASLATWLSADENPGVFAGLVIQHAGDISIVERSGTFLLWYDILNSCGLSTVPSCATVRTIHASVSTTFSSSAVLWPAKACRTGGAHERHNRFNIS